MSPTSSADCACYLGLLHQVIVLRRRARGRIYLTFDLGIYRSSVRSGGSSNWNQKYGQMTMRPVLSSRTLRQFAASP
jgi:hypothetical protein